MTPAELFSLDGRVAVLTGAGGFLGQAMAAALLEAGARLIAPGRSTSLDRLAACWIERYGEDRVATYPVDLADPHSLDALVDALHRAEPQIDVLVNNAHQLTTASGFNTQGGTFEEMDAAQWSAHLDGGTWWAARLTQGVGDQLKASAGSVVNVSSMYGLVAPSPALYEGTGKVNPAAYSVAKAGLMGLTRYLASYWGQHGVRVNALLPGPFSDVGGDGQNSVTADDPFLARLGQRTCLGRTGRPEELAGALVFLASAASSYMTGHGLVVDGGWTVT